MPILQFQCRECRSIFEQLISRSLDYEISCVSCNSGNITRTVSTSFYPNKSFCPHDKELEVSKLKYDLPMIMKSDEGRCGGCGTDGAAGACNVGVACKSNSGGCKTCSCGRR